MQFRNIRRVRMTEPLTVIPIRDREGRAYKGYKGDSNYRYDIWEMPDGKWRADVVSMFDAHQPGERPRPHPAARRIMKLFRDDMLAIERNGGPRQIVRIVKFSEKQFAVAPPNEAGALKARDADKEDPFKYIYPSPNTLKTWRGRKVDVDEVGRVRDPGFGARTARRLTRKAAE
jgi:CRISPR-associated endonuclease Csn1